MRFLPGLFVRGERFDFFDKPTPPPPRQTRTFYACPTHCCPVHGCKYAHVDCPVLAGRVVPEHPNNNGCELCERERKRDQEAARRAREFSRYDGRRTG